MGLLQCSSQDDLGKPAFLNHTSQGNAAETTSAIHWEKLHIQDLLFLTGSAVLVLWMPFVYVD